MKGQYDFLEEIIVDNFAGGGGASTGMELATGRPVAIAINHDPDAIAMHETNHPFTEHLQASVWDVDPREVCRGRPVGLAWFSPDCKHFSKAKGAALVDRKIRGLAWIVLRWAGTVRPRVIIVENVEEFKTWGPVRKGKPIKAKSGQTFERWLGQLKALGYTVESKELVAADYGAPTTRKRLVIVARCDGKPIVWPKATYAKNGEGGLKPWVAAHSIIEWEQPMYSIFASKQEIKERYGVNVVRPLKENTLRRIIRGVDKFTIKSGDPFLIPVGYGEKKGQAPRVHDINQPLPTVVGSVKHHVVDAELAPIVFTNTNGSVGAPVDQPIPTVRTGGGGGLLMSAAQVAPFLAECNHSGSGHISDMGKPLGTVTAKHTEGVVAANLIQYHTEQTENMRGQGLNDPIQTIDGSNRYGLAGVHIAEYYGRADAGYSVKDPMHTATSKDRNGIVGVHIQKYFGGVIGEDMHEPLPTVTAVDHNAMTAAHIAEFKGQDIGQDVKRPLRTGTTSAGQFAVIGTRIEQYKSGTDLGFWPQIRELLNQYCGYELKEDQILLLTINGVDHYIRDIFMRMLIPRELYAAMGFPKDYIIDRCKDGTPYTKTKQVARCGNAVCPQMAEAVVRANLPEWCDSTYGTMAELMEGMAV